MLKRLLFLFIYFSIIELSAQTISYERDNNTTTTYDELVAFYQTIDQRYEQAKLIEVGLTDVGKPLHLLILSKDKDFDPKSIKTKNKAVILMNNGIHPGEPEGIDVAMMYTRDVLQADKLPKDVVICIIPVYNIAGMLNRGVSRVNQNGPDAYGFRGSLQNYDLNRDFIKTDTRNSYLFQQIFQTWDPDVFFDTHTSNGADYQHVMTLIATQKDKLAKPLGQFLQEEMIPTLYAKMEKSGFPMVPYVNTLRQTPESGLVGFLETGRYSSGYAALHHTIGFMPETHMWKTYHERVQSTQVLFYHFVDLIATKKDKLLKERRQVKEQVRYQHTFPISWNLDTMKVDSIQFLGFESDHKLSLVTGLSRLYYDRAKTTHITVPFFNTYQEGLQVKKPYAYILPQSYDRIVDLLRLNGVKMLPLSRDTIMHVEMYYIKDYKTSATPYEGHYLHHSVMVNPVQRQHKYYKGDWLILMDQIANRFVIETLEPHAPDSYFNWNFFDAILSQKEYFSPYIFEEEALKLLQDNPTWRAELDTYIKANPSVASNSRSQLDWIYKKSKYYEKTHLLYPIGRLLQ